MRDPEPDRRKAVAEALGAAQRLGALGDRPIPAVIDHSERFVEALADVTGVVADLGSGGGVPGLVVAACRPDLEVVLVDRRTNRTDFLDRMVRRLGWDDQVTVRAVDAEQLIRQAGGTFDAAVARGFGPPDVTLSVAARLVRPGGVIVISEPPHGDRWPRELVDRLGVVRDVGPRGVARFVRRSVP